MESLGALGGSLPPPQGEDLQKAFRHAALSITTMYQASKKASANGEYLFYPSSCVVADR